MTVLGITAEYNPFHNGHLHHLKSSKELCSADYAVCVMSGNFIQRGEPAVADKWARAEMALRSGIDLVIELPVVYAMSSAEFFAFGAVKILDSLGVVDYISFGSEAGDLNLLDTAAAVLSDEPESYKSLLKDALNQGISYPAARQKALGGYFSSISAKHTQSSAKNASSPESCTTSASPVNTHSASAAEALCQSNNILGIEYLKALKRLSSNIKPLTVPRLASSYNSEELTGTISSATSIRCLIGRSEGRINWELLKKVMPEACADILLRETESGRAPVFSSDFDTIMLSTLRHMASINVKELPYVSEGLENRIIEGAASSGSIEELIEKISTRRYTKTRIQRILFSALTGITSEDLNYINGSGGPCYIRILGFNEKGRRLLSIIKKQSSLPIIMKPVDFLKSDNPVITRMIKLEAAATDQYVLAFANKSLRKSGQEFTRNILRIQ